MKNNSLGEDELIGYRALALLALRNRCGQVGIFSEMLKRDFGGESPTELEAQKEKKLALLLGLRKCKAELEQCRIDLDRWREQGITTTMYFDDAYPAALRTIFDPPLFLYCKGSGVEKLKDLPAAAIVGSRRADHEGCSIAKEFARALAAASVCIVSGLALGIDAAAHEGALTCATCSVPTVAILGNGLASVYPRVHTDLAERILGSGGLLLSQFEPDEKPLPHNFLNRNRLIAGISRATIIVQATARSGSLSTARHAIEEGRDLLVVPGSIHDPRYSGSNRLLREGATILTEVGNLWQEFPDWKPAASVGTLEIVRPSGEIQGVNEIGQKILALLSNSKEVALDAIIRDFNSTSEVTLELLNLEMLGLIQRLPGNILSLCRD